MRKTRFADGMMPIGATMVPPVAASTRSRTVASAAAGAVAVRPGGA